MSNFIYNSIYLLGFLFIPLSIYAQEDPVSDPNAELDIEKSAEVFLETYSDDFQEAFFEALKQKGIENYDKAVNAFLKCRQLDASNAVVDHELAKVYYASGNYPLAEEYALTALTSKPDNVWFTTTFIAILEKQGRSVDTMTDTLPFDNAEFGENLASIYLKKGNYETALTIIKKTKQNRLTEEMISQINDSIQKKEAIAEEPTQIPSAAAGTEPNPLEAYKTRMEHLIQTDSTSTLQELSEEAIEIYPAQPYFYFVQGRALNMLKKPEEAIAALEGALDFLIDDTPLENKIYQELANAYTALNDPVKAKIYLSKMNP